ncbi:hypothetical protein [Oceanihabitans sediminis]|uniref:hypothetical protein n=1 Tax=Oceanihabitans sediminis TaxID=1812012 RepID=UPI00299E4715|nr:hypothetical protein [Oceanihabitans sediminis]MDX1279258.1 hypothetical protein [Oceanihabitans sediminis]MDX1773294.1 hypothetical protein [Oceanihabitans sediminis]
MKRLILTLGSVLLIATSVSANSETPTLGTKDSKSNTGTVTSIENMYYWGVESNYGKATGYANSLEEANKMVALVGKKDIITYKKVISK